MMNNKIQKNLELLLGDPKKAIVKLSIPIMIGSFVQTLYSFVDGIWVSGVGSDPLAAIGLFMPFMMVLYALAMGIGVGGSSAISRAIGAGKRERAGNVAEHTLISGTVIGSIVGFGLLPFLKDIFLKMGASQNVAGLATTYGTIIIIGAPLMFVSSLGNSILRGEGDTKRAMYLMLLSSVLNMILDPIFIFGLNLGVVGAAIATDISITVSAVVIMYWLLVKKDSYVQMKLSNFRKNWDIVKEIFGVGLPSSLSQISMSLTMIALNTIVISAGGDYGMSVFSAGWRVVMLAIVPLTGIAAAVTSVTGAAYGARNERNLKVSYLYGIKIGTILGIITGSLIWIFAPQITYLFTYSESSSSLAPGIVEFLRYIVFYFPVVATVMLTSSLFRGIKKGMYSLIQTVTRSLVMQVSFAYLFAIVMDYGLVGVWVGIVVANVTASLIAIPWGLRTIKKVSAGWKTG